METSRRQLKLATQHTHKVLCGATEHEQAWRCVRAYCGEKNKCPFRGTVHESHIGYLLSIVKVILSRSRSDGPKTVLHLGACRHPL